MTRNYPTLDVPTLRSVRIVQRLLAEDPNYLTDPLCPYTPEIVQWFNRMVETSPPPLTAQPDVQIESLEMEIESLLRQLKGLKPTVGGNTPTEEQLTYIKTATTLLDKLITIKERASKIQDIDEFRRTVLGLLADVMTPEQRTSFMDKLKDLVGS